MPHDSRNYEKALLKINGKNQLPNHFDQNHFDFISTVENEKIKSSNPAHCRIPFTGLF